MMNEKNISQIGKKCVGCGNCKNVCPKQAVRLVTSDEGFLIPEIIFTKCIQCGKCLSYCPAENKVKSENIGAYGLTEEDKPELMKSASGGAAYMASKLFIDNGGYVCGCVFDENLHAVHIVSNNLEDIRRMRMSKYVQSDVSDCFPRIKELLKQNKKVLFIGTPCQVHALSLYAEKYRENLTLIDIICHGCPSPGLFSVYIRSLEKKEKGKIANFKFRYKLPDKWGKYYIYYEVPEKNRKRIKEFYFENYGYAFFEGLSFRESCYTCSYTSVFSRPGDITLGDFWHVDEYYPQVKHKNGVSAVLINTEKGNDLFQRIREGNDVFSCDKEEIIRWQENLNHPVKRPEKRDIYYKNFSEDFYIAKKGHSKMKSRLVRCIPPSLKEKLKNILR